MSDLLPMRRPPPLPAVPILSLSTYTNKYIYINLCDRLHTYTNMHTYKCLLYTYIGIGKKKYLCNICIGCMYVCVCVCTYVHTLWQVSAVGAYRVAHADG